MRERISRYRLLEEIGGGGMGVVYRARDEHLERDVALKVLRSAARMDESARMRFRREARALSLLSHPSISTVFDFDSEDGVEFLVMELVEGPTLADSLAVGPIPLDEALLIARQIAEALEAAHEQGIIHRDLKPANIKVRGDGTVKVLDFGLAKAMDLGMGGAGTTGQPGLSMSPTLMSPAMTQAGMILGTAAYMAPEQARGKTVDRRADTWSFGVVVFEMLSGRRAFGGDNASHTLALVMTKEPEWAALPASTPPALRGLLRRCLDKDPKRRLQAIGDARLVIEDLISEIGRAHV